MEYVTPRTKEKTYSNGRNNTFNFKFVSQKHGGRQPASMLTPLTFQIRKAARSEKVKSGEFCCITVAPSLMHELGWKIGDRCRIGFDFESRIGCIVRTTSGNYTLSGGNGKQAYGTVRTAKIKWSFTPETPYITYDYNKATKHEDLELMTQAYPADQLLFRFSPNMEFLDVER